VNHLLSGFSCRGPLEGDEDRRRDGDRRILEAPAIASDPQRIQLDIKQCTALIKQLVSACPAAVHLQSFILRASTTLLKGMPIKESID
jgi:hypothetical protein